MGDKDTHMPMRRVIPSFKKINNEKREFGGHIMKVVPGGTHYITKQQWGWLVEYFNLFARGIEKKYDVDKNRAKKLYFWDTNADLY
jgi:hypothetical protein